MKPTIELKNVHVNERLSEETACFSADLVINGKPAGTVGNRGHGGCNEYHLKGWDQRELNDLVKAMYPKWTSSFGEKEEFETDLDMVVLTIVEDQAALRSVKRRFKSKIVLRTGKRGQTEEFGYKGVKVLTQAHWDLFNKAHPDRKGDVMNHMTDAEILEAIK